MPASSGLVSSIAAAETQTKHSSKRTRIMMLHLH
jgi:hypothetical protein